MRQGASRQAEFEQQMLIKKRETVAEFPEGVVGVSGCEEG